MLSSLKWSPMRKAYGQALVRLGEQNPEIVALSADVANSDFSSLFAEVFPDRFFNVGIAEQALVDVAAGLAYAGKIPFANTFAFLFATRAFEMIRTHLCYGGANVKLMGAFAGLSDSFDGPTHHSITDLAALRSLPNMTVVVPSDPIAVERLMPQVAAWPGPVYFRLNRNDVPVLFGDDYAPEIGVGVTLKAGSEVTLLGTGMLLYRCLAAAEALEAKGISTRVIEIHTLKPIDSELILQAAAETGALVTAEEHSIIGGLGAAVAEITAGGCPVPVIRVGIADQFAESGPYLDLLDRYGMSVEDIVRAAFRALALKGKVEKLSIRVASAEGAIQG